MYHRFCHMSSVNWGIRTRVGFAFSYIHRSCHDHRMKQEPTWKSRELAIEFWFAAVLVGGSYLAGLVGGIRSLRSEEHTSELQSLMRNSYAVFCLKHTK